MSEFRSLSILTSIRQADRIRREKAATKSAAYGAYRSDTPEITLIETLKELVTEEIDSAMEWGEAGLDSLGMVQIQNDVRDVFAQPLCNGVPGVSLS